MNAIGGRWALGVMLALTIAGCAGKPATKPNPASEMARQMRMAQAYLGAGRNAEAIEAMEEAVRGAPENAGLRNFYGQVLFVSGHFAEAEVELRKALELDPFMADAHNNLGALYDRTGRKDEAEREFRFAIDDPSYPTPEKAYLNLGLLYGSQGRDEEAIRSLRKAVEIDPKYYQAHYELASLLDKRGMLEEAIREYVVAAPDFPTSGEYHFRLGFAHFRLGDRTKARESLWKAVEVAPGSEAAARAEEILKMLR